VDIQLADSIATMELATNTMVNAVEYASQS